MNSDIDELIKVFLSSEGCKKMIEKETKGIEIQQKNSFKALSDIENFRKSQEYYL
jgi:hypothetical protein